MSKMWKAAGEEQKLLEKLFQEREVNGAMKPGDGHKKYPMFIGFTSATFRKHWYKTKQMFEASILGRRNEDDEEIIEIDGTGAGTASPFKVPKLSLDNLDDTKSVNISFKQPPIVSTVYTDPDTKQNICLVIVSLLSRIKKIDFDVVSVENYQVLKVTYEWPLYSYSGSEMFKTEGSAETFVKKLHPKFLAVEKPLEGFRENFEDAPLCTIDIKLPATIQIDPGTWKHYFNKKADGTLLVFFEFLCIRHDYIIKKAEKSISFD